MFILYSYQTISTLTLQFLKGNEWTPLEKASLWFRSIVMILAFRYFQFFYFNLFWDFCIKRNTWMKTNNKWKHIFIFSSFLPKNAYKVASSSFISSAPFSKKVARKTRTFVRSSNKMKLCFLEGPLTCVGSPSNYTRVLVPPCWVLWLTALIQALHVPSTKIGSMYYSSFT